MSARCTVLVGDARERLSELPAQSVRCCATSPEKPTEHTVIVMKVAATSAPSGPSRRRATAARTSPPSRADPFAGTGTTIAEAVLLGRRGLGIELNPEYAGMAEKRIGELCPLLAHGAQP